MTLGVTRGGGLLGGGDGAEACGGDLLGGGDGALAGETHGGAGH